jgi:hypothetical protein
MVPRCPSLPRQDTSVEDQRSIEARIGGWVEHQIKQRPGRLLRGLRAPRVEPGTRGAGVDQAGTDRCDQDPATKVVCSPGDWRMIATTANGQPAAVIYHRDAAGLLLASGVVVLDSTATGVSRAVAFHDPALVTMFGFPDMLAD